MGNVARAETVAVIPAGEAFHARSLSSRPFLSISSFSSGTKFSSISSPSDAAKRGVVNIETDVFQLVEVTENPIWANLVTPVMKTNRSHWSALFSTE